MMTKDGRAVLYRRRLHSHDEDRNLEIYSSESHTIVGDNLARDE
jgi:hypothetical protein